MVLRQLDTAIFPVFVTPRFFRFVPKCAYQYFFPLRPWKIEFSDGTYIVHYSPFCSLRVLRHILVLVCITNYNVK